MRRKLLPFGLLIFCLEAAVFLSITQVEARQKCRIQPRNQALLNAPVNPGTGGGPVNGTAAPNGSGAAPLPAATTKPFKYGTDKIRGVNIGGWLVLEPWITPSFFDSTGNDKIIDEYTLGQYMDPQAAFSLLKKHWETWMTEDDFAQIAAAGLNHVRIPVGYWSIPLTSSDTSESTSPWPYVPGAWPYLLNALTWCKKYNIKVIIDLHGAPGSQNGYDNSGQLTGNPVWAINKSNVTRTVDTLRFLAKNIGNQVSVIELLNEAGGFKGQDWQNVIRQFWLDGYDAVREVVGYGVQVMIGDAFMGITSWTNFLMPPRGQNVLMDFHEYQIFSHLELSRSFDEHINFACGYKQSMPAYAASDLYTVLGEWSNAVTDCAKWLNGRGVGSRWDNTWYPSQDTQYHGSCSGFTGSYHGWTNDYKDFLRKYFEVQIEVGEAVQGWVFWTWKAENADEWSYQKGLEGGWIPQDPTNRKYPNICH